MAKEGSKPKGRPFVSMYWECCHVYSRIYKNKEETAYAGKCPKCHSPVSLSVGTGGTNQRTFVAVKS